MKFIQFTADNFRSNPGGDAIERKRICAVENQSQVFRDLQDFFSSD